MKPKRIILIRHGESEGNMDKNIYGGKPDYALQLTENGIDEADKAGKKLKELIGDETAFFYISPMWRTRMTFEQIVTHYTAMKPNIKGNPNFWIEEPRIREQEWGHFKDIEEGRKIDTLRDAYGPFYYRIPDGESVADVYDRVSDFLGTLHRDFEKPDFQQNAIIITHGMLIRVFLMRWLHWSVEEFESYANPDNCQMVILEKNKENKFDLIPNLKTKGVKHRYQRPIRLS